MRLSISAFVSTSIGTKKGRIFIRGAPFKGSPQCSGAGAVAANCPPGSATVADNHSLGIFLPEIDVSWISV